EMKRAEFAAAGEEAPARRDDGPREFGGCRGAAPLVVDHADLAGFARQALHGANEILSFRRIDPGAAQNYMGGQDGAHGLLARRLAGAVDGKGIDGIFLDISAILATVEDIIRREMNQWYAELGASLGQRR